MSGRLVRSPRHGRQPLPWTARLLAAGLILSLGWLPTGSVYGMGAGGGAALSAPRTISPESPGPQPGLAKAGQFAAESERVLPASSRRPRVNVPHFDGTIAYPETALLWFGQITPSSNYADARLGYNDTELLVNLAVFDRRLWYPAAPSAETLTTWDSVSLYLALDGPQGDMPSSSAYRMDSALLWWEAPEPYRTAFRGDGSAWMPAELAFTAQPGWRGDAPNNNIDDRGWSVTVHLPFSSLGLDGPPAQGTTWGLGLRLHDRDDAGGTSIADQVWPTGMEATSPSTWGELAFGLPGYALPSVPAAGTTLIRQGQDGAVVPDGAVGGGSVCGAGTDYFAQWGEQTYAGAAQFNIQNQADVADWPCFSKYYVTFPTGPIPADKVILSATLTLHQFGNAGAPGEAGRSLVQVYTVADAWSEAQLTWNNAPLADENISRAWVDPLNSFPGWPGVARSWDVSQALAEAYTSGLPLRLALYSADFDYHSGKYFTASDAEEWDAEGRPTLDVVWGNPDPEGAFDDVPPSHWAYDYIEALFQAGYVAGCSSDPLLYCPERILSRAESAVFMLRGSYGSIPSAPYPPPSSPTFADVAPSFWGFTWIESLWLDHFTAGCGTDPLSFCPLRDHSRAEASVFFLRIKNGADYTPPAAQGIFSDVPTSSWAAAWVEDAYSQNLLPSCFTSPLAFCPDDPLDRAWAAYMMVMAKGGLPLQ